MKPRIFALWCAGMVSVFLRYDRDDAKRAKAIARALERGGHAVWWDRQIAGGAEFAQEIEQELGKSTAVAVLWSRHSIQSACVRDKAAEGRGERKLVPVSIDGTLAPMGFRQYQVIDLSAARSERGREMRRLLAAIAGIDAAPRGGGDERRSRSISSLTRVGMRSPPNWRAHQMLAVAVAVAGGGTYWYLGSVATTTSVTIAASEPR